jgi:hypothetical protein
MLRRTVLGSCGSVTPALAVAGVLGPPLEAAVAEPRAPLASRLALLALVLALAVVASAVTGAGVAAGAAVFADPPPP